MNAPAYASIRDILGYAIGKRIVDITQHDKDDYVGEESPAYVQLLLEGGEYIKFYTDDGGFVTCFDDPDGEG